MAFPNVYEIARGHVDGWSSVNKFGSADVPTTASPVTTSLTYQMPLPNAARTLRIAAGGDALDTALGTGARAVIVEGLDATGGFIAEEIATNGTGASSLTTFSFWRVFRAYVSTTGNYPTGVVSSQADTITIEDASANVWGVVPKASSVGLGQSQIAAYTVRKGFSFYIEDITFATSTVGKVDLFGMRRENTLSLTAPFAPFRQFFGVTNFEGVNKEVFAVPVGPLPEYTDVVFFARAATGTQPIEVAFNGVLMRGSVAPTVGQGVS